MNTSSAVKHAFVLLSTIVLLPTSVLAQAATPSGAGEECSVTEPTVAPVPTPSASDAYTPGATDEWYMSADGQLLVSANTRWQTGSNKVIWYRPPGLQLEVSGRRLDADAPPLGVDIPEGYPWNLQVSALSFPTDGCWQIDARAGDSALSFVVAVEPGPAQPPPPLCGSLYDVVTGSQAIFIGTVARQQGDPHGYVWQELAVSRIIRPRFEYTEYLLL